MISAQCSELSSHLFHLLPRSIAYETRSQQENGRDFAYREKVAGRIASAYNAVVNERTDELFNENIEDPVIPEVAQSADDVIVSPPPKGGVQKLLLTPKRRKT